MDKIAGVVQLLERGRKNGPMCDLPLDFVAAMLTALTDAMIDYTIKDPANAGKHSRVGFDALWRMIG
jgi:hypothetical protein